MSKTIFNPFEKFSENQLLTAGLVFTVFGSLLGYFFNMQFDGVLDAHPHANIEIARPFINNTVNTFALCLALFALGRYINKKTRFIDVLNTALISRSPFYLLALGNANDFFTRLDAQAKSGNMLAIRFSGWELALMGVFSIFTIAFLVWFVILLYNGFKTATNLKSTGHKVAFAFAVIVAEIISKTIMYFI
ncbi:hypothetical protein GR160_09985 [Flavobacterium sp. Sd200]|uniref:YIP1 family protein n=1 Tax=Flavobacterium sp. Sd200 TaxID=2692211 RepID=UPI00136EAE08|nr:YIP1 family protein [Flavobacterium sp. Sd200]MXN91558.1 hypothetical protein [Flavobacterium sp. Sd200]